MRNYKNPDKLKKCRTRQMKNPAKDYAIPACVCSLFG